MECVGVGFFGDVCLHPLHCVLRFTLCSCFVSFVAGAILSERFLSLDLTQKITFSDTIALLLGLAAIDCFDFRGRRNSYITFCMPQIAPRDVLDVSCVTTIKHECCIHCVLHPMGCSVLCTGHFMCYDYQT